MEEDEDDDRFIEQYGKQLHHVDEFSQVVLNGHFEVEGHLDDFLSRIFEHQSHLDDARLTFHQKLCIARAYTPRTHHLGDWEIISSLNQIRNKIAHRSVRSPLEIDTVKLRGAMEGRSPELKQTVQNKDDKELLVYAALTCCGFLITIEEQLAEYKAYLKGEPKETD